MIHMRRLISLRSLARWLAELGIILFGTTRVIAQSTVTLAWDPNTETNLAGYIVYYGTNPGVYTTSITLGNVTNNTVSGLREGRTYCFAVTAYNTDGLESEPSNEISYLVPTNEPPSVTGIPLDGSGLPLKQKMNKNTRLVIPFTVSDPETPASNLVVSAKSSNPQLIPNKKLLLSGTDTNRTLTLVPIRYRTGKALITLSVNDGQTTRRITFMLVVTPANNAPAIVAPAVVTGPKETNCPMAGLRIVDVDAGAGNMRLVLAADHGTLRVSTSVAGGLTAGQVTGNGKNRMTILAPLGMINRTLGAPNGLVYRGYLNFVGNDTVGMVVSDNGNTGTGGAKSAGTNLSVQVTGNAYDVWRMQNFSELDLRSRSNEEDLWGDQADPDHDGRGNLMEFALGLNPNQREVGVLDVVSTFLSSGTNQHLGLSFRRRASEPLLEYLPEVSQDKLTWQSAQFITNSSIGQGLEVATYTDLSAVVPAQPRFIRLRVRLNGQESTSEPFVGSAMMLPGSNPVEQTSAFGLQAVHSVVYAGAVTAVSSNSITDADANWTQDEFNGSAGSHYAEFDSGMMADIVQTDGVNKRLVFAASVLGFVEAGEKFRVRKHFTIADVFGAQNQAGLLPGETSAAADKIVLFDPLTQQSSTYFYRTSVVASGWCREDLAPASNTVIYLGEGVMLRRLGSPDVALYVNGAVKTSLTVVPVLTGYNLMGSLAAEDVRIADLNLMTGNDITGLAAGADASSADNLIVIGGDGTTTTYFYCNSAGLEGWCDQGLNPAADITLPPGTAFYIHRKSPRNFFYWQVPSN